MATINNVNLTILTDNEIRSLFDPEELRRIYDVQHLDYCAADVELHAENMLDNEDITEDEFNFVLEHKEELAKMYIYKYQDCSLAENDIYACMIENYLKDYYEA